MFNATVITNYATTGPLPSYIDPVTNLNDNNVPKSILIGSTNGVLVVDGIAEQTEITTVDDAPPGNLQSSYFLISSPSRDYYVWYNVAGGGIDPSIPGRIGLQVAIPSGDIAANIAIATGVVLDAVADFSVFAPAPNPFIVKNTTQGVVLNPPSDGLVPTGFTIKTPPGLVLITSTNTVFGDVTDIADVNSVGAGKLTSLTKTADGTATTGEINTIDASYATPVGLDGTYFLIYSTTVNYYVWFNLDGTSVDPAPALTTGIEVAIVSTDSDVNIGIKLAAALNATLGNNAEQVFIATGPNTSGVGTGKLNVGDLILVKDEPAGNMQYNGVYKVDTVGSSTLPWKLIRDFDSINMKKGDTFYVESGVQNAGTLIILNNNIIMAGEASSPANFIVIMGSGAVDFNSIAPVSATDMCGDLIVRTDSSGMGGAGDTWTALPVGSVGQFLSVTGTGLQCIGWETLDANVLLSGVLTPLEGEMLVVDSSLNVVKLPAPSGNGQILQTGTAPPPLAPNTWKNIQWSPFRLSNFLAGGGTGNVIAFNGVSGNWEVLGVGVDGQVLTADSSQTLGLKWESGTATAAGYDNSVQFKLGPGFANDDDFEYDPATDCLTVPETGKYGVKTGGGGPSSTRTLLYTPGNFGATTGTNVAVGDDISTSTGFINTLVFGVGSAGVLNNGDNSIIIGNLSAVNLTNGNDNLVLGHSALATAISERNVAIGNGSLASFVGAAGPLTGGQSTAVGYGSLASTSLGTRNTAVGFQSLGNVTLGDNCAFGYRSAYNSGAAAFVSAFGFEALNNNTNGNSVCAFGYRAMGVSGAAAISNQCAFGYRSLGNLAGGTSNNAFGADSLFANSIGSANNAFGQNALFSNLIGSRNSAFGHFSLAISTGSDNTAVGNVSLTAATSSRNTSVGSESLQALVGGSENNAFGYRAAANISAASNVCAFGTRAINLATAGDNNNAFGDDAMRNSGTTSSNNAFGYQALENITGSFNCGFGEQTLRAGSTQSCAFGYQAASSASLTAARIHAFGYQSLAANQGGTNNNAFGYQSLLLNTSGANNSAFGNSTLSAVTTTSNNSAFGYLALQSSTGFRNNAFGSNAMIGVGAGSRNGAFGYQALTLLTSGNDNCAFGDSSASSLTMGSNNTSVGSGSLATISTNSDCTAVGYQALALATGGTNTAVGSFAGDSVSVGTGNTLIGYTVATALTSGSNNVVAGNSSTAATLGTGSGNVIMGVGADVDVSGRSDCVVLGNGAVITSATHSLALGSMITDTSAPTNGTAGAVPAQPATYLRINVNGTIYKIALWEDTP